MPVPLQTGSPAQYDCVRDFFRRADFDDATLCRVLGIEDMSDLGRVLFSKVESVAPQTSIGSTSSEPSLSLGLLSITEPETSASAQRSAGDAQASQRNLPGPLFNWCLRVFVQGLTVTEQESRQICGEEVFSALVALGLLRRSTKSIEAVFCPIWVYPADGFVLASDRRDDPEGGSFTPPADIVFPAIYAGTLRFLHLLPAAGGDALDLCGGSGIGALHLSRTARLAATADITQRSAIFAAFNARLNGVPMQSLCGDLYAPVAGKQYDLISAHPPFVPDTGPKMIYRDGGDAGEELTRRIIEGLPNHLRPGGTCVILCVARDTKEESFEQRARAWLGSSASQFDLVFGLEKTLSVEAVVDSIRKRGQQMTDEQARQLLARLRSIDTRQFVYGALFLRRSTEPVNQPPLRIRMNTTASASDFERLFAWRHHCRRPGFQQWLAASRPRLAPGLELTARHLVQEGALVPGEFVFSLSNHFEAALRPDAFVVPLVARLNGTLTVAEIFQQSSSADELPQGFTLNDFMGLVEIMIERGFLELELL
jgi:SAM-dependent methyltransferase